MSFMRPTAEVFNEPRPNYNPNGDKSMTRVIVNAKFDQPTEQPTEQPTDQPTDQPTTI
jgi:hypothetical protein